MLMKCVMLNSDRLSIGCVMCVLIVMNVYVLSVVLVSSVIMSGFD